METTSAPSVYSALSAYEGYLQSTRLRNQAHPHNNNANNYQRHGDYNFPHPSMMYSIQDSDRPAKRSRSAYEDDVSTGSVNSALQSMRNSPTLESLSQRHAQSTSMVTMIMDPPAIVMPIDEQVSVQEDRQILYLLDAAFSKLSDSCSSHMSNIHKIYQKRLTVRSGIYYMGYSWKYNSQFKLKYSDLEKLKQEHLNLIDIIFNVSGDCCSMDSNATLGISSPCYCDMCGYSRSMADYWAALETLTEAGSGTPVDRLNTLNSIKSPMHPSGPSNTLARCLLKVKATSKTATL